MYGVRCTFTRVPFGEDDLDTPADDDDVVGFTKPINGRMNGLAHRRELVNKANSLLSMLSLAGDTPA
jgi:predicted chitinase